MGGAHGEDSTGDLELGLGLRVLMWLVDTGFLVWVCLASAVLAALIGFFLYIVADGGALGWTLWAAAAVVGIVAGVVAIRLARSDPDRLLRDDTDDLT